MLRIQKMMMVPGAIENWIILIDLNQLSILKLNYSAIGRVIQVLQAHFTCTLEKMYILNPSSMFSIAWKLIKRTRPRL